MHCRNGTKRFLITGYILTPASSRAALEVPAGRTVREWKHKEMRKLRSGETLSLEGSKETAQSL